MPLIEDIKQKFERDILNAPDIQELKNQYLGRKRGIVTEAFKRLSEISGAERKNFGQKLNGLKSYIETKIQERASGKGIETSQIDFSLPLSKKQIGHLHPLTQTERELEAIFQSLGFSVELGWEIESDWYNFTALNFPPNHPARDTQDTFFLAGQENKSEKERLLLRTHTSPMQVRFMETHKPPFAIIVPGTVYRNEATDATHEHTIQQLEGLVVGENINFGNMAWIFNYVFKKYFGPAAKTRLLPSYFPFVEPGAEVAVSSPGFQNGRWVEIVGCGMTHQKVFENAGYPKNKYQGFAFGFGSIRFPLMKHSIPDIRLLHENNLQFLNQF